MTPRPAMAISQTRQIGPNSFATLAVPKDWPTKRPIRITRLVISTAERVTCGPRCGMLRSPSIAESTEIDGVIRASP